jgi:hypothetical protein
MTSAARTRSGGGWDVWVTDRTVVTGLWFGVQGDAKDGHTFPSTLTDGAPCPARPIISVLTNVV